MTLVVIRVVKGSALAAVGLVIVVVALRVVVARNRVVARWAVVKVAAEMIDVVIAVPEDVLAARYSSLL
jgi:hypothetical protein